jgi:rubrerythrin
MSFVIIVLSEPNIEWLRETPEHLESARGLSRYRIAEADQNEHFGESEWFCDECGALVEDVDEGCPVCA